jgi:hypothetical protein
MAVQDRPEVVRVMPGARAEPALVALLAVVVLVGAAIWKPWANGPDALARPVPAEVVVQPRTTPRAAAPVADAAIVTVAGDQPIAAVDLSIMGSVDSHEDWGVSAAFVPITEIAVATRKRLPSVEAKVDWTAIEPGRRVEIAASRAAIATVALAVTWQAMRPPREVRLFYLGAPGTSEGAGNAGEAREVQLLRPLPRIVTLERRVGREHFHPSERVVWPYLSGVFYLPPSGPLPARPRDWLSAGWPAGEYEFRVTDADGTVVIPFGLRGSSP